MQRIQVLIKSICERCHEADSTVSVSEPLAAFMVKAVLLDNSTHFQLDKELNDSDVEELIRVCIVIMTWGHIFASAVCGTITRQR